MLLKKREKYGIIDLYYETEMQYNESISKIS